MNFSVVETLGNNLHGSLHKEGHTKASGRKDEKYTQEI